MLLRLLATSKNETLLDPIDQGLSLGVASFLRALSKGSGCWNISVLAQVDSCCNLGTPCCYNGITNSNVVLPSVSLGPPRFTVDTTIFEMWLGSLSKHTGLAIPVL